MSRLRAFAILKLFDRGLSALEAVALAVAGLLTLLLIVLITYSVFSRYVLGDPLAWNVEISEYILLTVTLFSASYILKVGGHVTFDLVTQNVATPIRRGLKVLSLAISLAAFGLFGYYAFDIVLDYYQRGTVTYYVLQAPRALVMAPLVIGSILLTLRLLLMLLDELTGRTTNDEHS